MRRARALVAAVLVAACAGCADSKPSDFSAETEATFVRACAQPKEGTGLPEDVCRCAYDRITKEMTFEEFEALDDELELAEQSGEEPQTVPEEVADAFAACSGEAGGSSSVTSSSSTTTTTRPSG